MKLGHFLTPYTKIKTKWIKDLNVRLDTIQFLEENIGRALFDINCSNVFLDPSLRVMEIKAKINKWDLIKLKNFCIAKKTINKMKRQPIEWEKIFTNNETAERFVSKTYKQLMILNSMKTIQSNSRQKITNGKELIELLMKVVVTIHFL